MNEFAVTCVASGNAIVPVDLGVKVTELLYTLKEFGPIGRSANDGTSYQATLVVEATSEEEARRIAVSAMMMGATSARLPGWPIRASECFVLAPLPS
ncbi:MAG: hypothetical protein ACOYN3_02445 [Acidimicrobiia bacterium]